MEYYVVEVEISCNAVLTVRADGYGHAVKEAFKRLVDAVEICVDDSNVDDVSFPCFDCKDVEHIEI